MWWVGWACAWAGGPAVELPAGEDPAAWLDVLTLVGLEAAEGGDDDVVVRLSAVKGRWHLVVPGTGREAWVDPPTTGAAREDVAQLAASLWSASTAPVLPGLPPLPALPPVAPAPAPTRSRPT